MDVSNYADVEMAAKAALCLRTPPCRHGDGCAAGDGDLVDRVVRALEKAAKATPDELEDARREGFDDGEAACDETIDGLEFDVKEAHEQIAKLKKELDEARKVVAFKTKNPDA